jgi:hypothetical protein
MLKKKILIVSRSFYPINTPRSFRTTELVKEFSKRGHEVVVLTHKNCKEHVVFEKEYNVTIKDLGSSKWKGIKIKGGKIENLLRRMAARCLSKFFEYPGIELMRMVRKVLKNERGYDLLISIAVPHTIHWGVASIWNQHQQIADTWVADCGDPYMGAENNSFKPAFYFGYLEKMFCKKADYIAVPTEASIKAYYPFCQPKIRVIPQGFNFEEYHFPEHLKNIKPVFAYAGSFIPGLRDPSELLSFLNELEIDFEFLVYAKNSYVVPFYADKSRGRIKICAMLPRADLLNKLATVDFVVNFENKGKKQTPSKLIDYIIVKKPILAIETGTLNKALVMEFINGNYSNAQQIENTEQYRIQNVCKQFIDLIKNN